MEEIQPRSDDLRAMTPGERVLLTSLSNHLKPLVRAAHWMVGLLAVIALLLAAIAEHMGAWQWFWTGWW